jgi:hypothetical protein
MNNNVLGQAGSIFFFGTVENNQDPEKLGRVKVRVHGIHSPDKGILPVDLLPWASVMLPVTSNEGGMHDLYEGTTVFGFFLDGDEMQVPFVTGVVPGLDDSSETTTISPHATQRARASAAKKKKLFDEPADTYAAQYPHNRAVVTKSGHVVEYDDTPGAERIHIFHTSGAYIEFLPDGRIVQKSVGDQFSISAGKQSIKASDNIDVKSEGSMSLSASGSTSIESSGGMDISAASVAISAGAASIALNAAGTEMTGDMVSSGVITATDVIGGGYSLAGIGSAIDAGGGLGALTAGMETIGSLEDLIASGAASGGWGSNDTTPPIAPASFTAAAAVTGILVSHAAPTFTAGGGYKLTHIYLSEWVPGLPRPTIANAQIAHSYSGTNSSFQASPGKRYVVWARWETKAGVFGAWAPDEIGLMVETGQDVAKLTELIRQEILTSDLYAKLHNALGIDVLSEALTQNTVVTQKEVENRRASIKRLEQTVVDATSAAATSQTLLEAAVANNSAKLLEESSVRATTDGFLGSSYSVRSTLTSGGRTVIGGFGLTGTSDATKGPEFDFGVSADRFWIGAPNTTPGVPDSLPFTVQTTPTVVNGVPVPVGVYITDAFIKNGTITNAKIADAAIDNAKIISLDASKITTGFLDAKRIQAGDITADKITVNTLSVLSPNLGNITGGSLNIGSGTANIDANGNAIFRSLEIIDNNGQVIMSVKPAATSFTFPEIISNVPSYINNDSIYIDANGNLSTGIVNTESDPLNLIDHSALAVGTSLPNGWITWSSQVGETSIVALTDGPKGIPTKVIRAKNLDTSTGADGGYGGTSALVPVPGSRYRVIIPVRRNSSLANGGIYLGPGPQTASLHRFYTSAGVLSTNPYFLSNFNPLTLPVSEWCIVVGYLLPFGTAFPATAPTDSGLYKVSDGSLLAPLGSNPFVFTTDAYTYGYTVRALLDGATELSTEIDFGAPFVHEVNGTEPSITAMFKGMNIRTLGYAGDLDATKGAPAGTLVGGVAAETVATAATNFNTSNDRNAAAIVAPTIATDGTAVDHALQTNATADISFEWAWSGVEGDIDGFRVYVYSAATNSTYSFGTTPSAETVYELPANKRAFILYGVTPNLYYTFGVQAYRSIDKGVDVANPNSSVIVSAIVKPSFAGENPYQPSANVAFAGNVTGTINGTLAAADVNKWDALSAVPYSTIFNNDDSTALGYNPAFGEWVIADATNYPSWSVGKEVPKGWAKFAGTETLITKETNSTFVRVGANSVKMIASGTNLGITRAVSLSANPFKQGVFLSGTLDLFMQTRTAGLPGIQIKLFTDSGLTTSVDTEAFPENTATGVWHRIPWSARVPAASRIYGIQISLLASFNGWVATANNNFTGTVYFDNMRFMLADNTTDNISLQLTETAGTLSVVGSGGGTVTTITPNNQLTLGNVGTFVADGAITSAKVSKFLASDDFNGSVNSNGLITSDGTRGWVIAKGDGSAGSNRMIIDNMTVRQKITANQIEVGAVNNKYRFLNSISFATPAITMPMQTAKYGPSLDISTLNDSDTIFIDVSFLYTTNINTNGFKKYTVTQLAYFGMTNSPTNSNGEGAWSFYFDVINNNLGYVNSGPLKRCIAYDTGTGISQISECINARISLTVSEIKARRNALASAAGFPTSDSFKYLVPRAIAYFYADPDETTGVSFYTGSLYAQSTVIIDATYTVSRV